MTEQILWQHKLIWEKKKVLREIYNNFYKRMLTYACKGPSLEIGGGCGNLKSYLTDVISTDIVPLPWVDQICDAQNMPFSDESFSNIFGIDVLHHIESPVCFFKEAERVLRPGGRVILTEPAITLLSYFFYHYFHPEPVDLKANPLNENIQKDPNRKPFDANQAIPELLAGKFSRDFEKMFPKMKFICKTHFNIFTYLLSGGFRSWYLMPSFCAPLLLSIENFFDKFFGNYLGFRLMIVIEKKSK